VPGTHKPWHARDAGAILAVMANGELAQCLRAWRDRLAPADVGLPGGALRRAPGLRREELAPPAGLSADYLTRLEQGRARHPSREVVQALARALRLSRDEQAHLYRLAGHAPPGAGRIDRHLTPGIQRVLDRLGDLPVIVIDPSWEIVDYSSLAAAFLGDFVARRGRERNLVWRHFTGASCRVIRDPHQTAQFEAGAVGDLHAALGHFRDDPGLRALIADLRRLSQRFEELWQTRPVAVRSSDRITFEHPEAGRITLDCDMLTTRDSDLRLVVYSAAPGTPDADALAFVGVLGLQQLNSA
jgi:transcriptional regulator with XRE-family HTH domain